VDWDPVELVLALEERFGIRIPDKKAERMLTVGHLYIYLLEQTRGNAPLACPSSLAFYHLRRTLTGELGVDRGRVRPDTLLRDLIAEEDREAALPRLAVALALPDLPDPDPPIGGPTLRSLAVALATADFSVWVLNVLILFLLGWPVAMAAVAKLWMLMWFLVIFGVCFFWGALWLEARQRRRLPRVRDLVMRLVLRDCDRYLGDDNSEPTPEAIWTDLVAILSQHIGIPADQIHPDLHFIDL
jgi:hypothetical protein